MTKNSYQKCMDWTERNIGIGSVRLMVRALTAVTAAIYCVMAAFLLVGRDGRLIRFILVPAVGFVIVTLFRKVWVSDQKDGTYINPIIHADYSDRRF